MAYKNIITLVVVLLLTGSACQDPYNDADGARDYVNNDNKHTPTELDNWLTNTFTLPYNIEVKYRWDNSELNPYRNLVPPAVDKVQGVMEVVKKVWIDTYAEVASATFIKEYCPKQFVLVGSASYNFDGSFTIGTAEGGRKVVLYVINNFDPDDHDGVKEMIHTVEHEFGHILHQTVAYDTEFKEITAGRYTANWASVSLATARANGFITSYAMASPDEDFVEMIAVMLVEGKAAYERILSCETNATARALLRQKEQMVVEYFREAYDIDFYELQTKVQEAINEIAPGDPIEELPPVFDVWGFDKEHASLRFDLNFMSLPSSFVSHFLTDHNALVKHGYGLHTYFRLYFASETDVKLQLYYYEDGPDGRVFHEANFRFTLNTNEDGSFSLWYQDGNENAAKMLDEYQASKLFTFFANNSYEIDWERSSCPTSNFVGFYPVNTPNDGYTFGVLGN
jgi:substrate import-associated zinc metallohydrolase lipoprotein